MIPMAARSFTLPPGFRYSSFAKTSPEPGATRRLRRSIGVWPTNSVISSATRRQALERIGTLQGTEAEREASIARIESLNHPGIESLKKPKTPLENPNNSMIQLIQLL